MLQSTESLESETSLPRITAAETLSQDVLQGVQPPTSQPVLENGGPSNGSEDTITLSRSEYQRPLAGASAGQHVTSAEHSDGGLVLSLRERPAPVRGSSTTHPQPANIEQERSATNDPSASSDDVTAIEQGVATGHTRGEVATEAGLDTSVSLAPAARSLHRSHRLPRSVWKTRLVPEADPEQVRQSRNFPDGFATFALVTSSISGCNVGSGRMFKNYKTLR